MEKNIPFHSTRQRPLVLLVAGLLSLAGCKPQPATVPVTDGAAAPTAPVAAAAPLQDLVVQKPTYLIGITYPKSNDLPAPLVQAMQGYSTQARARLEAAAKNLKPGDPGAPYDLSLEFRELPGNPMSFRTIAAEGSLYSGGARGEALIRRFVWDVPGRRMLSAQALVPTSQGWQAISTFVRDALLAQARTRFDADKLAPADQQNALAQLQPLVEAGTQPDAANFADFEPQLDAQGRMVGLTFVFPPYQVAGYADGTQQVDVPASVLLPWVAPDLRSRLVVQAAQ